MGANNRTLTILGSVVLIVIVLAGWGLKVLLVHPKSQQQSMEEFARQAQAQAQALAQAQAQGQGKMPDIAKLASLAGMGGDQGVMLKLMTQYRMDPRAASYLSQTKIKVIDESNASVHYVLTFPDGVISDEVLTIKPDQHYTPSAAELKRVSRSGIRVFQPKLTQMKISEDEVQFTLHYYVAQNTLPPNVVDRIHKAERGSQDFFTIVPAACAQEGGGSGGDNGTGFVGWNIAEMTKSMGVKGLEHAEWEKAAKGLDNILTLKDLVVGYGEISDWLGEVAELEDCAKNPTNPLTQKASQTAEYQQQVTGGLNDASWDVQMTAFPKVANIAAGAVTQFLPFGTGVLISPITSANDEAVAQIAQDRIADAKKMVVPCDKDTEGPAFGFRPMAGKFEYKYNDSHRTCSQNGSESGCNFGTTVREEKGAFVIDPDATEAEADAKNRGSGSAKEDSGFENPKCHGATHTTMSGAVKVSVEVMGTPESAIVRLIAGSGDWNGILDASNTCSVLEKPVHRTWDNAGAPGVDCKFTHVNMIHGGHYATFSAADNGKGTCEIELERK